MKYLKESGQVTIEFILTFIFSLSFFVFFLYYGFNYTVGYLAHYATFVSSRTFLTYDVGNRTPDAFEEARVRAEEEFTKINLRSFGATYNNIQFNTPGPGKIYEYTGAYLSFDPPFKLGLGQEGASLLSESFLGKEPMMGQCQCQLMKAMGFSCNDTVLFDVTLYDNGC